MNPWTPIISFVIAVLFLDLWIQVAKKKFHPYAMVEWVIIGALSLVVIAAVVAVQHLQAARQPVNPGAVTQSWHNPLDDLDLCSKTGQVGGPPITNNQGCPGYQPYQPAQIPEIDASTFGSHPDLGPVPTLTPRQLGTR